MTNREKADEIASTIQKNLFFNSTKECLDSAMAMAKWKDEEFVQEKQQLVEKACEWLLQQEEIIGISFTDDFIVRFRKAMEE